MNDPVHNKAAILLSISIWAWLPWIQSASQICAVILPFIGVGWWIWRFWTAFRKRH